MRYRLGQIAAAGKCCGSTRARVRVPYRGRDVARVEALAHQLCEWEQGGRKTVVNFPAYDSGIRSHVSLRTLGIAITSVALLIKSIYVECAAARTRARLLMPSRSVWFKECFNGNLLPSALAVCRCATAISAMSRAVLSVASQGTKSVFAIPHCPY